MFQKYERAIEVVIPCKRDKRGKRFGFARFLGVRDPDFFATQLDNIIIGSRKIYVNIPMFGRSTQKVAMRKEFGLKQPNHLEGKAHSQLHQNRIRQEGTSYANAVKNRVTNFGAVELKGKCYVQKRCLANMEFSVGMDQIHKLGNAYVGKVCIPGTTYCFQDELHRQGYFDMKATPMGANLVLLETDDVEDMQSLINDGREWLTQWFSEVQPWRPREIDNERLTWIRC